MLNQDDIALENLRKIIEAAACELYLKDSYLIKHEPFENGADSSKNYVSERGIVFKFGCYLEQNLRQNKEFLGYNLDVEYNRNKGCPKVLKEFKEDKGVVPDMIIHKRGSNKYNLLVVEVKTWWSELCKVESDKLKIKCFMDSPVYNYKYGLFLIFNKEKPKFEWFDKNRIANLCV